MTSSAQASRRAVALYVHVPFCVSRCAYCTFVSGTDLGLIPRVVAAICAEIGRFAGRARRRLVTVYLGGGTPSVLPGAELAKIVTAISSSFSIGPSAEITFEANPDDVTKETVEAWRRLGFNRLSIGVQSFDDGILAMLGRRHTAADAVSAASLARAAGFVVSLDLMVGLPGQTREKLTQTMAETLALRPEHLSVYILEMDKPHALGRLAQAQPGLFPNSDEIAHQYFAVARQLVNAGYRHYEISNFCLPGHAARHNTRYWRQRTVLPAGPGAHGQAGRRRWANHAELAAYLAAVEAGATARAWGRTLDADELRREAVMLGLRTSRGVNIKLVEAVAGIVPALRDRLDDFFTLGLAQRNSERVWLTRRGFLLSNELLAELW